MKKFLVCVFTVMFFTMMPFLSFAKESIPDNELGSLTAQEGVTIDFGTWGPNPYVTHGNVAVLNFTPTLQSWGDGDGFGAGSGWEDAGWVGAQMSVGASQLFVGGKMDIDVGTNASGYTAVRIGLPSAFIHTTITDTTLKLSTGKTLSDAQPALGTVYNDVFAAFLNMSTTDSITISNHASTNSQGVEISFNPVVIRIPGAPMTSS